MFLKNKIKYYIFSVLLLIFLIGAPHIINAATISLTPSSGIYEIGNTIHMKVVVTSPTSINAVSGRIEFSNDTLSLLSLSKTGSIVNLWAQDPSYSNALGTASFEGIILDGYKGSSGVIIDLIFKAKASGVANVKFSSASILANDGNGTDVTSGKESSTLTINKAKEVVITPPVPIETSLEEVSTPVVAPEIKVPVIDAIPVQNDVTKIIEVKTESSRINDIYYQAIIAILFLILVMLIIMFVIYKLHHKTRLPKDLSRRLLGMQDIVTQDFDLLNKDMDKEIDIYSKLKRGETLSSNEMFTLSNMPNDIKFTEKEIIKKIKKFEEEV